MIDVKKSITPASEARTGLNRTLVLVGLMGAGKTSVGKRLAALLDVPFVDSDTEIVQAASMTIPEIFEMYGEQGFRDGERRVIARLLADRPGVLATGGGAFIEPDTRKDIKARATSVWLRAGVDLLWDRVRGRHGRPLLDAPDPKAVLAGLERARAPLYAEADVIVDSRRGASHEVMAREIIKAVRARDRIQAQDPPTLDPLP